MVYRDNKDEDTATKQRYKQQACQKQQEWKQEWDLWDVIEQYKELAETNKSVTKVNTEITKEKVGVGKELQLTKKVKIQQCDLVYDYCKLEKVNKNEFKTK